MKIRLMLADDHRMFREALRAQMNTETGIEIVAESGNGEETISGVDQAHPDVLVLDIALPDMSGVEVARRVLKNHPTLRIVVLSGYADRMFVNEMLKAGARAYVVKSAGTAELISAIHAVMAGHLFLSPEITLAAVEGNAAPGDAPPISVLGGREREVLRLLAKGMQSTEIAEKLGISTATVKSHRRNIKHKLNINSTAELTRYAIREGLQSV
jgi:two-component system NarL family response regulator